MRFRPCIDLHNGLVKQIVGSTLRSEEDSAVNMSNELPEPVTNFETNKSSAEFAQMYAEDNLPGGHVIMLGPNNEQAALEALAAYPNGMQVGGGISASNARDYIEAGASHVIITSWVFKDNDIAFDRLQMLLQLIGKDKLVLDLSCRKKPFVEGEEIDNNYYVVTDKWQKYTNFAITQQNLYLLSQYCGEFLVHGVEVEGKRCGILEDLVRMLGEWSPLPVTYAGGASQFSDLDLVKELGRGKVDLTIGSALDIFGGEICYREVVDWQRQQEKEANP